MHRFSLRVRYADVDQMGFAYYAHYLRWFEIGRTELIRFLGMSYKEVEEAGISFPVLEARCRYLQSARYDDRITVETGVLEFERASIRFGYRVLAGETELRLIAHGFTDHCFMGREGRPVRPPRPLADLLDRAPRVTEDVLEARS